MFCRWNKFKSWESLPMAGYSTDILGMRWRETETMATNPPKRPASEAAPRGSRVQETLLILWGNRENERASPLRAAPVELGPTSGCTQLVY